MTVEYKGMSYGHQQIWTLVAALGADGIHVGIHCGAMEKPAVRLSWDGAHVPGVGEPGDRTPFRALKRAIEKKERGHVIADFVGTD